MRIRLICVLALTVFVMFVAAPSFAKGLLGNQYFDCEIGIRTFGDDGIKNSDDSLFSALGFNVPMSENVDALINLSYGRFPSSKIEGDVGQIDSEDPYIGVIGGGINYHFTPDSTIDPYVGVLVGFANTDAKTEKYLHGYGTSEDENDSGLSAGGNDFAFSLSGGIEVDISDLAAFRPAIVYKKIGDENDVAAGLSLNVWFTKSFFSGLATSYTFENGDFLYAVRIGFGF